MRPLATWRTRIVATVAALALLPLLSTHALANLSLALHLRGNARAAKTVAEVGADFAPNARPIAWAMAASAPTEATTLAALELVVRNDPNHKPAALRLGYAYADLGRHEEARAAWSGVGAVAYFERLALDAFEQGRQAEATEAARQALALGSQDGRVHVAVAEHDLASGDREAAARRYLSALEHLDPASLLGLYAAARAHELRGDLAGAEAVFARLAHERFPLPERARGLTLAGQVALKDGRPADALAWLQRAEALLPLSDWGRIVRGEAHARLGDPTSAVESLRQVSPADPRLFGQATSRICSLIGEGCAASR